MDLSVLFHSCAFYSEREPCPGLPLVLIRSLNLLSGIIPPGRWTDQLLAAFFKGILFLLPTKEHAGPVQTSVFSRAGFVFPKAKEGFSGFAVHKEFLAEFLQELCGLAGL